MKKKIFLSLIVLGATIFLGCSNTEVTSIANINNYTNSTNILGIDFSCQIDEDCIFMEEREGCCVDCSYRDKSDDSFYVVNILAYQKYRDDWSTSHPCLGIGCPECIGTITNSEHLIAVCQNNLCVKTKNPECINTNCPEESEWGY